MALVLALPYLTGCARFNPKEIKSDKELYFQGQELFNKGKYRQSSKRMEELIQEYFESEYKVRALFILAESQFMRKKYEEAQSNYDKFLEIYPAHEWAEIASYRSALCDFNLIINLDKDQTHTIKTLEKLNNFLKKYPNSTYKNDVEKRINFAKVRLAEQELYIADFYLKTKAYGSAIARYEGILTNYPNAHFMDHVLYSLGIAYEKAGEKARAREIFKKLNALYPTSKHGRKAKDKL